MPAPWLTKASRSDPESHHVKFMDEFPPNQLQSYVTTTNQQSNLISMTSSMEMSSVSSLSTSMVQSSIQGLHYSENVDHGLKNISDQKMISEQCESRNMEVNKKMVYQSSTGVPIQTTYESIEAGASTKMNGNQFESEVCSGTKSRETIDTFAGKTDTFVLNQPETNISGKISPMECVEKISEILDDQQLVQAITSKCKTSRLPSPTTENKPDLPCEKIEEKSSERYECNPHQEIMKVSTNIIDNQNDYLTSKYQNIQCSSKVLQTSQTVSKACINKPASPLLVALTTAPDRPYSPLPEATKAPTVYSTTICDSECALIENQPLKNVESKSENCLSSKVDLLISKENLDSIPDEEYESKKNFSSILPIKPFTPSETPKPIPMPEETTPYIPPEIPITIEKKKPREGAISPLVSALTTAPNRPYTPLGSQPIERGSLLEALTIAPDRPFSPLLSFQTNIQEKSQEYSSELLCNNVNTLNNLPKECIKPVATQPCQTESVQTSQAPIQTVSQLQSSTQLSAFKPVSKTVQTFPPPLPEQFSLPESCNVDNAQVYYNSNSLIKTQMKEKVQSSMDYFESSHKEEFQKVISEMKQVSEQNISKQNISQNYENSLMCEKTSSLSKRSSSGLHKPSHLPCYQKNLEQLPSQRGKTPEIVNEPAILQPPVTTYSAPETNDPYNKMKHESNNIEEREVIEDINEKSITCIKQPEIQEYLPEIKDLQKDIPITMTFQPVLETSRTTPTIRSRPTTPSLINKPAPVIPYYQMNLVAVEHLAPETNLYEPSSPDVSRSPTPKPIRSHSPAPGPPPNPLLKLHAPRISDVAPQNQSNQSLLSQATTNLRKEHEMGKNQINSSIEVFNSSGAKNWAHDQQSFMKSEQLTKIGFHSHETSSAMVSESSYFNQQQMQQATQSQSIIERGTNSVQRTKRVFEEFERVKSAKNIEIRNTIGPSVSQPSPQVSIKYSTPYPNTQYEPSGSITTLQSTLPIVSFRPQSQTEIAYVPPSANMTVKPQSTWGQPCSITSGANTNTSGPVCDPTPSTGGASAGGAGGPRGKTFGVSSAPKRGRGVLNKAAIPGTRIPLCGHCNGHIRGPFITALGRIWCPEHFVCVNNTCRRQLQDIGFVEENGQLYCEYCFEQFIAPACDKCHGKIKGDCLNAIGKHFHPECFNCAYCGKLFGNNPFFLEEGLPYCEADWNELFTTKCIACGFPVEAGDRWVEALNNNYHSQCFNCTMCKKNLEGQSFYAKGGRPFCKSHAR